MVNRLIIPNPQFADGTGLPYANGKLQFFATGTATPLATYSDSALTTPNANPIILDSAGRSGSVFLQNLAYKVQLFDANNVQIWSIDPVWSSDFSTVAQFAVNAGTPNGNVAGTAGTFGGLPSSVIWDITNNILYVCTTTGNAATAVWTAVNAASSGAGVLGMPGGRLTLTSGVPVLSTDVTGTGSVFYTPYQGNQIPIWGGAAYTMQTFAELTLTLNAGGHTASGLYDIFVFNNSGTLTLVTGPVWSTSTAGSGARGAGAGTTQLTMFGGILVNTVQITGRNGVSTFTIPASQATYVGSMFVDTVAGQVSCHTSYGQSRKWGIWNAYNRKPIILRAGDGTASWAYGTNTWRASNNNSANSLTVFTGLAEEYFPLVFQEKTTCSFNAGTARTEIGIGVNSTTVPSGLVGDRNHTLGNETDARASTSKFVLLPTLGVNVIQSIEISPANGNLATNVFFGTQTDMQLDAIWNG